MSVPDFTVVLGVDAYSLEQLKIVLPTWRRHKPSLFHHKFVVFYDKDEVDEMEICHALVGADDVATYRWPAAALDNGHQSREGGKDAPQRAMMLAGFAFVPPVTVTTNYFLKLDCDVMALGKDDWVKPEWFNPIGNAPGPSYVAPPWGYTVGPGMLATLDDWGYTVPALHGGLRLDFGYAPNARTVRHPRMCGWCSFYNTEFAKKCAGYCTAGVMPVPSHDTFLWYCATRGKWPGRHVNMRHEGWTTISNSVRLRAAAAAAMKTERADG